MENIETIIIPSPVKKEKVESKKKVLVEKESLPRKNRTITCKYCQVDKILNPDQYQALFDACGSSDERIKDEFMCKSCEMSMKRNPFLFWTNHGDAFSSISRDIKAIFDTFKNSKREVSDAVQLQNSSVSVMQNYNIPDFNFEFIVSDGLPSGIKIKNLPFVGPISLNVYKTGKEKVEMI